MSTNVVRQDVVKLDFVIDGLKELTKLQEDIDDIKRKLSGGLGDDAFDDLKNSAKGATDPLKKTKEAAEGLDKGLDGVKDSATGAGRKLTDLGKKAASTAYKGLKKVAGISFKALSIGVGAAATAVGALTTKAVQGYADYEQLVGGVETLFKDSAPIVQKYANDAYKTAGLSANDYMETVTGFSASLLQSLDGDTKAAAKYADMAVSDMADNANKMGTDMTSIQYAYQGFAKSNYTMLDNLKLGYGGTKEEMQRLVKDAAKIDKSIDSNSLSYANIVKAIHAVQENMGITGTTAKEAEHTITGSLNAMKSSWGNLLTAMASGENLDQCMDNMISSVEVFGNNLIPVAERALGGLGTVVERLSPVIADRLPGLAQKLLPPLIKSAVSLTKGLIKALPSMVKTVVVTIVDIFGEQFPILKKIGNGFLDIGKNITKIIPIVLALVAAFKGFKAISSLTSIFGASAGGGTGKKGFLGNLTDSLKNLGKTKSGVIAKGMANLAIILGGFSLITAAFMAIAPQLAKIGDTQSIVKMIAIIGALGAVAMMLTKFADAVGKIPIPTVLKGLANMALVVAGLSALFLLIGAVSLINFDLKRVLAITAIIGALGVVGGALSIFAGIVGMIPIPVVLAGLANMALVIGGLTALIVAYGALSEIKGFNDFIEKGGETLSKIFNVIGKCVGSIIGGLGEGITNSLPKIGANLSAFALSLKPMFSMFSGADVEGIGTFFKSMGSFMLQMAGNNILSFFTGGTNFAELGLELNTFATNSQGFFNTVSTFPENGFANATKLFNCLAGVKDLPKEGGVVGFFTGGINFENLANGMGYLSSEKVINFFNAVSGINQDGFDKAKSLFDCLAGMKSLPKEGGVRGWFAGDINFKNIAAGLGHLSGEGVKNFFAMVSGFEQKTFDNTKLLFETLAGIKSLPKEGGFWQNLGDKVTGKTTQSKLSLIATDLSNFGEKTKSFFSQINSLDLDKLNGLWDSLKKADKLTENVSKIVGDNISDIVKKVEELPGKMGDALKGSGKTLGDSLVEVWKDAVKASVKPVNKVLDAANWILKEFGSDKKVISWEPYAQGTTGHKGGNALVNDGNGAEMVQMPNGKSFIPQGRNVFLPNAPKGMKVLNANRTAQLMGKSAPTFHYANGIGNVDIWDYYDNPKGLVDKIADSISYKGMSGFALNVGKSMASTFTGEMDGWLKKLYEETGGKSLSSYVASKGVGQWRSTVVRALKMEKQYSVGNVLRTLFQMKTESGGNPKAINLWDSNAKKGTPSKGLMQVIDPTFRAYARSGFNKNIYDPLSNILASIRYAVSRYGSLSRAYRGVGYANGGIVTKPHVGLVGEAGNEAIIPLSKRKRKRGLGLWSKAGEMMGLSSYTPENSGNEYVSNRTENNTYAPQMSFYISGSNDDRALTRKIKRAVVEAMDDMVESVDRGAPKTTEV